MNSVGPPINPFHRHWQSGELVRVFHEMPNFKHQKLIMQGVIMGPAEGMAPTMYRVFLQVNGTIVRKQAVTVHQDDMLSMEANNETTH